MAAVLVASMLVHAQSATADEPFVATGHSPTQGLPVAGQYLTADLGTWTEKPDSYAFRWLRDGTPIAGATAQDYLVQPADIGHELEPVVTGRRGSETAYFTGTAIAARLMTATIAVDVRRVQATPGRAKLVWVAGGLLQTERPWPTDGAAVTAYRKKDGRLKLLGTATISRGAALVRLPWRQAPDGRTKIKLCFAGNEAVAPTCSGDVVRG